MMTVAVPPRARNRLHMSMKKITAVKKEDPDPLDLFWICPATVVLLA